MALHWHAYSFNLAGGDITDAKGRDDLDGFRTRREHAHGGDPRRDGLEAPRRAHRRTDRRVPDCLAAAGMPCRRTGAARKGRPEVCELRTGVHPSRAELAAAQLDQNADTLPRKEISA